MELDVVHLIVLLPLEDILVVLEEVEEIHVIYLKFVMVLLLTALLMLSLTEALAILYALQDTLTLTALSQSVPTGLPAATVPQYLAVAGAVNLNNVSPETPPVLKVALLALPINTALVTALPVAEPPELASAANVNVTLVVQGQHATNTLVVTALPIIPQMNFLNWMLAEFATELTRHVSDVTEFHSVKLLTIAEFAAETEQVVWTDADILPTATSA